MLGSREGSLLSGLRMGSDSVLVNSTKELFREGVSHQYTHRGPIGKFARGAPIQRQQLDEILSIRAKKPFQLAFPRELEDRFRQRTSRKKAFEKLCLNFGAIILFDLFLFSDARSYPQFFWRAVLIRAGLFTPTAVLLTLVIWRSRTVWVQEFSQACGVVLAGLSVIGIVAGVGETYSIVGLCGIFLVVIYGALVVRMDFRSTFFAILFLALANAIFLHVALAADSPARLACTALVGGCSILTLQANYRLEQMERTTYLLLLREELRTHELSRANLHLMDLTQVDELTGLANRRRLDQFLDQAWNDAVENGSVISVIMADMDHFKRLNDRAGHFYGDQILQRFAVVLRDGIRLEDDLAARFGGEEFAIVLPGRNEAAAFGIAERLRQEVVSRDLAHDAPSEGLQVTVSMGVATARPTKEDDPSPLMESADSALYQAKSSGRNCVRVHSGRLVETRSSV
jgi:diguanylate cyclase (GGDEF)-like protein